MVLMQNRRDRFQQSGTEAERTAYAPLQGADRGRAINRPRMRAGHDNTYARGTGSSRIDIPQTPGELAGQHPSRHKLKPAGTGIGENPPRAITSLPGKKPASHRTMTINRFIIVSIPCIGWFFLRCTERSKTIFSKRESVPLQPVCRIAA